METREKMYWLSVRITSPCVYRTQRQWFNLVCPKTLTRFKFQIERELHIDDTLVSDKFSPNWEMLVAYASLLRDGSSKHIPVALSCDHASLNVQSRNGENMVDVDEGEN